jgi:hypothetical protein
VAWSREPLREAGLIPEGFVAPQSKVLGESLLGMGGGKTLSGAVCIGNFNGNSIVQMALSDPLFVPESDYGKITGVADWKCCSLDFSPLN